MSDSLSITEILTPVDQAAVAETVRAAGGKGLAIYPIGGGTVLDRDAKPTRPGIGLSLAKLNGVIDYSPADMTITVEAGMTVGKLNRRLVAQRQWLPVDVPRPERATVGGAVARNAAGPRRYAYGTMRDHLLGFTAVDGTGMIFSGGGRVVKNAAGYNLCRLMAGSLGTLGVVTQATLLVRPLREASGLLACEVRDFDLAEKLLAGLVRSPVRPVAVELSAGRPHENNPLFGPVLEGNVGRLYVGFEGSAAEVEWMLGRLRQEWTTIGMTSPVIMPNLATDKLWRWISEFPADVRIDVLPSKMIETIVEVLKIAPDCAVQAHAGNGVIHIKLGERGEGRGEREVSQIMTGAASPGSEIRLMQAIKERFDPMNILNPGRFAR